MRPTQPTHNIQTQKDLALVVWLYLDVMICNPYTWCALNIPCFRYMKKKKKEVNLYIFFQGIGGIKCINEVKGDRCLMSNAMHEFMFKYAMDKISTKREFGRKGDYFSYILEFVYNLSMCVLMSFLRNI